ncbi:MAG: ankyrin repeat domain-containing protein [Archangiaceae bacterium]|nr:ankyrin repeat domain-containing protein [Archangiaceae bacterium]
MKKKPQEDPLQVLWSGDPRAIEIMLHHKVDLNHTGPDGRTLLMETVLEKRADLAKLLLENGVDVKRQDREGETALHFAAQAHLAEVVQLLIDKGAVIDAKDHRDETPLFKALSTFRGEAEGNAVWALMLAGADRSVKNVHGVSPEDLAKRPSNYDLGQFFR